MACEVRSRRSLLALLALLVLGLVVGTVVGPAAAAEKLRVGVLPFSESLGAVVADKQGFFKAEGLDVELTKIASGSQAIPVLMGGKLDIVFSNTITTLQVLEQGLDITMLAPGAVVRTSPPDTTSAVIVRKGTLKSPRELEGKRLAVNVVNSSAWLYLMGLLDKHGVDPKKVEIVEVPFPQMNDPLLNGQLDAISQVEPFRTVIQATGKADIIGWTYVETQPNADITQYVALTSWVNANRDTAAKFARAVVRGAQFVNANEAATREANLQFTRLNPALKDKVMIPRMGTEVNGAEMKRTMELMLKFGLLKRPVDFSGKIFRVQ